MNEFDQFAKHQLKTRHYFRYCDDFIIVHTDKKFLEEMIGKIHVFLKETLFLDLHPHKIEIRKVTQGIDFLGYIALTQVHIIRTKTKKRAFRNIARAQRNLKNGSIEHITFQSVIASYKGIARHANEKRFEKAISQMSRITLLASKSDKDNSFTLHGD